MAVLKSLFTGKTSIFKWVLMFENSLYQSCKAESKQLFVIDINFLRLATLKSGIMKNWGKYRQNFTD